MNIKTKRVRHVPRQPESLSKGDKISNILLLITCYVSTVLTATDAPYEIQKFRDNPGMHFEKFRRLHYAREIWKLVIELDHTTI